VSKIFILLLSFIIPLFSIPGVAQEKTLVFDFTGVLYEFNREDYDNFIKSTLQISEDAWKKIREQSKAAHKAHIPENVFWKCIAEEYHLPLPEDWDAQHETVMLSCIHEIEGMRDLIQSYQQLGYQVALLSNVYTQQAAFLRRHGFYNDFSLVFVSSETGLEKPDPRAYQMMLDQIKVEPKNCIFIDDTQENVDAAKALGIDAILFLSPEQIKTELNRRI
jgi:epoxide hydrolase-like predicted phosphatase